MPEGSATATDRKHDAKASCMMRMMILCFLDSPIAYPLNSQLLSVNFDFRPGQALEAFSQNRLTLRGTKVKYQDG